MANKKVYYDSTKETLAFDDFVENVFTESKDQYLSVYIIEQDKEVSLYHYTRVKDGYHLENHIHLGAQDEQSV